MLSSPPPNLFRPPETAWPLQRPGAPAQPTPPMPTTSACTEQQLHTKRHWDDLASIVLIIALVTGLYLSRLATQPVVGEETRWATGAREMLVTGDWIVPRQQAQVFPERPPMTMWAIALVGLVRGDVDIIAIRLPSVLAVLATSLMIFAYGRALASPFIALVAAIIYATFGQVLQIGRLGESEALFTLFVSSSLLLWHWGYCRHWPPLATWSTGFAGAALGALVKGPQAPVYFITITSLYLLTQRDLRQLLRWQFFTGLAVFAAIVGTWQIPFYLATDWPTVKATWSGLAADRIHLGGLAKHLVTYPAETFVCLLPWAPLLAALIKRETRELLGNRRPIVTFLYTAILVAYPTVWLATGARGRYFMPLYPLVALLIAIIIEQCSTAEPARYPRRAWHQFLLLTAVLTGAVGLTLGLGRFVASQTPPLSYQSVGLCLALAFASTAVVVLLHKCYRSPQRYAPIIAVLAIAAFVGIAYTGIVINTNTARWNNPTNAVANWRNRVTPSAELVSLSAIEHRFAYFYGLPIEELAWPTRTADLPANVEYFCFMRNPGDTAERRAAGRGRAWITTPGTLPFAWQEIDSINVERSPRGMRTIVLGRVIRPIRAQISDATRPQMNTAIRTLLPPKK